MSNPRIGIIYPSNGIYELEFIKFAPEHVSLHFTRWRWPQRDWSTADAPDVMGGLARDPEIASCAALFEQIQPSVVTLGCTSVSFAAGPSGDIAVLDNIRRGTTAIPSSTSTAFLAACRALGAERIAVASVYRENLTQHFNEFLEHGGHRVISHKSDNWARDPVRMTGEELADLAEASDHPRAQAVLLPETNIHSSGAIPLIEKRLKKPVLTAVQVTVWHAVRLAGSDWTGGIGLLSQVGDSSPFISTVSNPAV